MFPYVPAIILTVLGSASVLWGCLCLYQVLGADVAERVALENMHGGGVAPERFAVRFVAGGLLLLVVGWFDWRWTMKRLKQASSE